MTVTESTTKNEIQGVALVIFDVAKVESNEPLTSSLLNSNSSILTFSELGALTGAFATETRDCNNLYFQGTCVYSAQVLSRYAIGNYISRVAIVHIDKGVLACKPPLAESINVNAEIAAIRNELLPQSQTLKDSVGTFLLIRCKGQLAEAVSVWSETLGIGPISSIPAEFAGLKLLPSPLALNSGKNYSVFFFDDDASINGKVTTELFPNLLPEAVFSLVHQLGRNSIIGAHILAIQSLRISSPEPSAYTKKFTGRKDTLLENYMAVHLLDRESAIDVIQRSETALHRICREGEKIADFSNWYNHFPTEQLHYAHVMSAEFILKFKDESQILRNQIDSAKSRLSTTTEHIRDSLMAEVADSNLKLQRILYWIAVLATILSLLGLAVGTMTDDIKKSVWDELLIPAEATAK